MKQVVFLSLLIVSLSVQAQKHIVLEDLSYVEDTLQKHKLDLFLPEKLDNAPVLLWIHGGAWAFGDRKKERELAKRFVEEGIVVAAISYRLSPALWADSKFDKGVEHPAHINDVAAAFAWLYQQADKYGYSKENLFVSGYSAGGHLSALLATDDRYLKQYGLSLSNIKGVIPIAGAYDILSYYNTHHRFNGKEMADQHVKGVFGNKSIDLVDASPTEYISNLASPMLLISETQSYKYTKIFEDKLKSLGTDLLTVLHVKDFDHKGLYAELINKKQSQYRQRIIDFVWLKNPN